MKRGQTAGGRRGAMLMEALLAVLLLGIVWSLVAQLAASSVRGRRQTENRWLAAQEAANLTERVAIWSWDETTPQRAAELRLSDAARQKLPDAEIVFRVHEPPQEPPAKRIVITVQFTDGSRAHRQRVELVSWKFRPQSEAP